MLDPPHKPKPKPKLKAKAERLPAKYPLDENRWEVFYWHGRDSATAMTGTFDECLYQFWDFYTVPRQTFIDAEQHGAISLGDEDLGITIMHDTVEMPGLEADESNNKMPESLSYPETQ